MSDHPEVGPTGDFPRGPLEPTDEGGINVAIRAHLGRVRVDFGLPVAWLAMTPAEAAAFASSLLHYAAKVEQETAAEKPGGET